MYISCCFQGKKWKELFRHETKSDIEQLLESIRASNDQSYSLLSKALTLHPLKSPKDMVSIYVQALTHKRQVENYKIVEAMREIERWERLLNPTLESRDNNNHLENFDDSIIWDTYTQDQKYGESFSGRILPTPFSSHWKAALKYLANQIESDLNKDRDLKRDLKRYFKRDLF